MKKTIIALTALIAATVGFQSQAQAGQKVNIGFEVQLGNGFSVHKIHQSNKYSHKHNKRHKRKGRRYGNRKHFHGHNYNHRCRIAGKRSIRRSLRRHGFLRYPSGAQIWPYVLRQSGFTTRSSGEGKD